MLAMSEKAIAMTRCSRLVAACVLAVLCAPHVALSHAALIEAETTQAIRLHAFYETGEPMAQAQVIIFAPDNPALVWRQGLTDLQGRFDFIPDAQMGRWSVQVRQAGHGAMAHVEMGTMDPVVITSASGPQNWTQRAIMIALVAWGALGTALWAAGNRNRADASS